jgi:hypothetical protein
MKKYILPLLFSLVSFAAFSQKGISYQAIILDPNPIEAPGLDIAGQPLVNGDVWMKFSIYNGSALQFEEIHKTKTDAYGLVSLLIGSVSPTAFNSVVWDANQKNMQVFASFDQGANYTKVSEQKLVYTPYALFSETAGKLGGTLAITGGGTGATSLADARVNLGIDKVDNTPDAVKPISAAVQAALDLKANSAEVAAGLALKANAADVTAALTAKADTGAIKTYVDNRLASGNFTSTQSSTTATITDADATTKGKIQLAGDLGGTAAAPTVPGLALKANTADVTTALALKADTSYVVAKVAAATIADADASTKGKIQLAGDLSGTAAAPTVPGLALKANTADVTTALALKANATNFTTLTNSLNTNTQSITSIASDFATLNTTVVSNSASITANSIAINSKAPLASPTFSGAVTAPIYASTPQTLTDASTIAWNPSLGLNASVTLGGNRTLSFTATPATGSYGTLVLTQDATGGRTITLPSTTNKVLGSTSSTTIDLSTAANAIDIVNFYYDGTNYYWNIGQGYGQAVSSGSTNLASDVTGTLAIANGGTGATTASAARTNLGLVIGTNVQAPLVAGTDYLAPNGSAANLTNFPTLNQNTTGNAATATLATTATNATTAGNITATSNTTLTSLSNLTTVGTITSGTWSGTAIAVANGGTGATTLTGIVKGNGTGAMTTATAGTDYLAPNGSAASLTNFPTFNQNTTGNAATATLASTATNATTAGNITATSNTTLTSLSNLTTVGTITSGTWSATAISVAKGGTGATTLTANNVLLGNGTSALQAVAPGASGNVLTSDGTTWTSSAPSGGSSSGSHTVGEVYGGGIVFYVTTGGYHGLIVDTYIYENTPEYMYSDVKNPLKHNTDKSGNLYTDWYIPSYQELILLYNARSISTIATLTNINPNVFMSSDYMKWTQNSPYRCLNFSTGSVEWINGDWTRKVIAIRSF